ncbi:MAG: DUF6470 family protein [Oscillospiraceae bacterium]
MEPLLKITSIPIDIEVKINRATMEPIDNELPKVKISRDKGEFNIDAEPAKIQIDNTRMYNSIGLKKPLPRGIEYGEKGLSVCYQGVAKIVDDGVAVAEGKTNAAEIAKNDMVSDALSAFDHVTAFIPEDGPDISWKDGKLSINYTADKLNIDFDIHKTRFKFTPGSVELIVNQLPRVEIEYTGEPIYFPASANPNYQG